MVELGENDGIMVVCPLVNVYISMERSIIFYGENSLTHYFDWAIFHSYVEVPEGKQCAAAPKRAVFWWISAKMVK